MKRHVVYRGILTIDEQILKVRNRYINIMKIDSLETVKLARHSLFSGMKLWLKGLVILVILSIFNHGNFWISLIGDLYCYSIFILLIFNIYQHCKLFYGLVITTAGDKTIISSQNEDFIYNVRDSLYDAMKNSTNEQIIINLDNCIINHGIISNGNENKNEVNL